MKSVEWWKHHKGMMMRTLVLGMLVVLGFLNASEAQPRFHVKYGSRTLQCSAKGLVNQIAKIFLQETSTKNLVCGSFENATGENRTADCFKGDVDSEIILERETATYGENVTYLRYDTKRGFVLTQVFECGWNYEEKCIPGIEKLLSEEVVSCNISTLKY